MAKDTKTKALAAKKSNPRAEAFEREVNRQERNLVNDRARRVKREGFKSESEYWKHTNPFRNTDPKPFKKKFPK